MSEWNRHLTELVQLVRNDPHTVLDAITLEKESNAVVVPPKQSLVKGSWEFFGEVGTRWKQKVEMDTRISEKPALGASEIIFVQLRDHEVGSLVERNSPTTNYLLKDLISYITERDPTSSMLRWVKSHLLTKNLKMKLVALLSEKEFFRQILLVVDNLAHYYSDPEALFVSLGVVEIDETDPSFDVCQSVASQLMPTVLSSSQLTDDSIRSLGGPEGFVGHFKQLQKMLVDDMFL